MISKKVLIAAVLLLSLLETTSANDKKIELEDIEQDNLKSEKLKEVRKKPIFMPQMQIQYMPMHQYDVEEEAEPKAPRIVYAMKNNNYNPTGHRYTDVKRERENVEPENNAMYQRANLINPNYVPMQLIYVPQYDPSPSNHINAYTQQYQQVIQVPFYYQPVEQQSGQKYAEPQIKYVEDASEGSHPLLHNYAGFVQHQAYVNNLVEDQGPAEVEHTREEEEQEVEEEKRPSIIPIRPLPAVHVPKVLPQYAHEVSRPVYSHISGNLGKGQSVKVVDQDSRGFGTDLGGFVRRKPNSLLESYIPSSIQLEYLRRGLSKEPLTTYDAVAQSHGFPLRNFEGGFLPNQMYPTAHGGVTFGHFKRHLASDAKI